jgi:hypothetical protein
VDLNNKRQEDYICRLNTKTMRRLEKYEVEQIHAK